VKGSLDGRVKCGFLLARTMNLTVPPHRTLAMGKSFVVLSFRAWSSLPHDVEQLSTHGRFVSALSA
jgi:hypothetical protein